MLRRSDKSGTLRSGRSGLLLPALLFALLCTTALSQDLPKKIRGYKVHNEIIRVEQRDSAINIEKAAEPRLIIGEPVLKEVGVTGITFELPAEIFSPMQSGRVELVTFYDVRVNGIPVRVEEYSHQFSFRRNESVWLPAPARIFLPTERLLQAAWKELRSPKTQWQVTGRVFVFGKFRRFGLHHKRVVPIDVDILIPNPLREGDDGS